MTEEETKANELVKQFIPYMYCYVGSGMLSNDYNLKVATNNAKNCALIAVEEILYLLGDTGVYGFADPKVFDFWDDVKNEINKL